MPFADVELTQGTFKKTQYIELPQGTTIIRILDANALKKETHFVNNASFECLGDECPVCQNNHKIIQDNPETFRTIKGYHPRQRRYLINVLDKTPVKVCPSCGHANKKNGREFSPVCVKCQTVITTVPIAPLNQVRVLAKGVELFAKFNALEENVTDNEGTPLPLNSYDINLFVQGMGKDVKIDPIPMSNNNEPVEVDPESLYELDKLVIKLTPVEINNLLRGVSMKDIFNARKSSTPDTEIPADAKAVVAESVGELFNA
jgi:hypothetical protein